MKSKKKSIGSYLCFGAPVTHDSDAVDQKHKISFKVENRKLISKIVRSLSINSDSVKKSANLQKNPSRQPSKRISDTSAVNSVTDSFGKSSDATIFTSSSSSSSSSSLSYAPSLEPEIKYSCKKTNSPSAVRSNIGYATGFCLLVLSLIVLVFCGRLLAILWTATWLCLVPRRRVVEKMTSDDESVSDNLSEKRRRLEEENRRVVFEGFLQRNRKKIEYITLGRMTLVKY